MTKKNTRESIVGEPALYVLQNPESSWVKNPEERARMTISCNDGKDIPRAQDAGRTIDINGKSIQIMHNGLKILRDGYQGTWESRVIEELRGIHEPQEEKVFYEVLKRISTGGTILELGSWWSYYSLWFLNTVKQGVAYCTEPDPTNLTLGKTNAEINNFQEGRDIHFRQYASGSNDGLMIKFATENGGKVTVPIRSVDSMLEEEKIEHLSILHFDIQGAELDTLKGAEKSINSSKIRFIFISTHHYSISNNPKMHQDCLDYLISHGAHIIAKHTVHESSSGDGLIVASFDQRDLDFTVDVSLQPTDDSLYRQPELDTSIIWEKYNELLDVYKSQNKTLDKLRIEVQLIKNEKTQQASLIRQQEERIGTLIPLKKHFKNSIKAKLNKNVQKR